jgi:putative methyltransferase (TIGR04325 family)
MNRIVRELLKKYCYPPLLRLYRRVAGGVRFSGDYPDWETARRNSTGYDALEIRDRVFQAMNKIKTGEAVFERDSVLLSGAEYPWPLIAGLLWIACQKDNRLNIVDFGGSLGSSYFQTRRFLSHLAACRWSVVEQKHFVETGRSQFEDKHLRFYDDLDACLGAEKPDVILLSSVLQYLPDPGLFINELVRKGIEFVIIDRTPFFLNGKNRLTVQKVPSWIYPASYPAWIMNYRDFLNRFVDSYDLIAEFPCPDTANIDAEFKGLLYGRKR